MYEMAVAYIEDLHFLGFGSLLSRSKFRGSGFCIYILVFCFILLYFRQFMLCSLDVFLFVFLLVAIWILSPEHT